MAFDAFLKLDDIKGESTQKDHKDEIAILSYSFGVSNSSSAPFRGGGAAGRASFKDMTITKRVDKASPTLFLRCAAGTHIKSGTIAFVRRTDGDGGAAEVFLKLELTDVLVSSTEQSGSDGDDAAEETLALNFSAVKMTYTPQGSDGKPGTPVLGGWDIKTNKAL